MHNYDELKAELREIATILNEFPEPLRERVFDLLLAQFQGVAPAAPVGVPPPPSAAAAPAPTQETLKVKRPQARRAAESYKLDKNLSLRGDASTPSFRDFVAQKSPRSTAEFNATAVYYLCRMLNLPSASLDQVYTCYDEAKRKPANFFRQSVIDTKNKQGWLDFDEEGNVVIPLRGVAFVEHDLPRPAGSSSDDE